MKKIEKAVVLCAGRGNRLGALTKILPKPMLPIGDKPALHLILEQLADAEIKNVLLIVGYQHKIIRRYFKNYKVAPEFKKISNMKISYKIQHKLNGTGGALMLAQRFVWRDDFLVVFADDLSQKSDNICKKLLNAYSDNNTNIMAVRPVKKKEINNFGIVFEKRNKLKLAKNIISFQTRKSLKNNQIINEKYKKLPKNTLKLAKNALKLQKNQENSPKNNKILNNNYYSNFSSLIKSHVIRVDKIVEKPHNSRSNLANFGRYIFTPEIFNVIKKSRPQNNGEIYLTDALNQLARSDKLLAVKLLCNLYDIGSPAGYKRAFIHLQKE